MSEAVTDPMRPRRVDPLQMSRAVAAAADALGCAVPAPTRDAIITGVTIDSRSVRPGDLYVALPGARRHGAEFIDQVLEAGASGVVTDSRGAEHIRQALGGEPEFALAVVEAPVRAWVGPLSGIVYGTSDRSFPLFAVTGTNGKTTTTYMLNALQRALGRTCGIIGTIEILAGDEPIPSLLTTPESPSVHGILARMGENGVTGAAMEVSSHAIDFKRVDGVRFDVAGFTNLTQDHLDLHGTMEDYFASKAQLLTPERTRRAVVIVDDAWGRRMADHAARAGLEALTLSVEGGREGADFRVEDVERSGLGSTFTLVTPETRLRVRLPLPGDFNVANAALAVSMLLASGVDAAVIAPALEDGSALAVTVPGRMQVVGTAPAAIVDFAHNPDAMVRAITSVKGTRTIVVFGATGDRDPSKRETMGRIAAELADVVIVTDDDPHSEEPSGIRASVLAGARSAGTHAEILEVSPRAVAIDRAVGLAGPEDTILVAGRGHETVQEVAGTDIPLDDRVELRRALKARGFPVIESPRSPKED